MLEFSWRTPVSYPGTSILFTTSNPNKWEMRFLQENQQPMRNRIFFGQGFSAVCHMPSLDNVVLIDFYSAKFDVDWQNEQNLGFELDHMCST